MLSVKDDCIAVMTPTETYYIEVDPKHFNKKEFCEALVERCRKSRSEYLGRPVYHDEYFEVNQFQPLTYKLQIPGRMGR